MKRRVLLPILILLVCGLLSCTKLEDTTTNSSNPIVAEISGKILDESNNGLGDVLVTVNNRSEHATTNDEGEFYIYLRPRSDSKFVWTEEIGLLFTKEDYTAWQNGSTQTSLATPLMLTIERGRTSSVRVELIP